MVITVWWRSWVLDRNARLWINRALYPLGGLDHIVQDAKFQDSPCCLFRYMYAGIKNSKAAAIIAEA